VESAICSAPDSTRGQIRTRRKYRENYCDPVPELPKRSVFIPTGLLGAGVAALTTVSPLHEPALPPGA
jgi:hypothetical protein